MTEEHPGRPIQKKERAMQSPRTDEYPTSISSPAYHYLGLTDYVELERAARRMRAQAIAAALTEVTRSAAARMKAVAAALFGPSSDVDPAMGFTAEDLRAVGLQQKDIRPALIGQAIGNMIAGATQRIAAAIRKSVAEAELYALDDRTLHDMGLNRASIPAAVAGQVYRPGSISNENAGAAKVQVLTKQAGAAA